jgi:hypothetical protein
MKINNKHLTDIVEDKIENKTHEVFKEIYTGLNISNGDISPEYFKELVEAQKTISLIISNVIEENVKDNKKALLEEKKKVVKRLHSEMLDSLDNEDQLTGEMLDSIIERAQEIKKADF